MILTNPNQPTKGESTMTQAYSDPSRESDPHALPDVEVFYKQRGDVYDGAALPDAGWYYWYCFPGCLPDSDPIGPFETEAEAKAAAQEDSQS
jgi:hypothetical protein